MLGQRRRLCYNIKPALGQRLVSAGRDFTVHTENPGLFQYEPIA